jgi:phospholipase A-2-activating protein
VIDLARLLSGFCADLIDNSTFFDALLRAADLSIDNSASSSSKAKEANVLLVLRTVANSLQEGTKIGDGGWIEKVGFSRAQSMLFSHVR